MAKDNDILVGVSAKVGGLKHHPLLYGRDYSFDKKRDLKRVEPASILLLSEVLASGVIPPDAKDLEYNDIDDPNKIAGRITNVFDAVDAAKELGKHTAINKPSVESPTPATTLPVSPSEGAE